MNITQLSQGRDIEPNRTYHEAQDRMQFLPNYYRWTYGGFRPYISGDVVELGCGSGLGIPAYLDRARRVYAVDFNAELMRRVAERFPSGSVQPIQSDLLGAWHELGGIAADTVIMMDVLEHFENDRDLLAKACGILKPGGRICLKVPAQSRLFSDMDRASGHYRRYDRDDVAGLAKDVGLRVLQLRQLNQLGGLAYRMKKRHATNFSKTFSMNQLRMINAAIPFIALTDRLPVLPGLSLTAVLALADG